MYDAIIIGSGFGGAMAAWRLVRSGQKVLLLERGDWVPRGQWNWGPEGLGTGTRHFRADAALRRSGDRLEAAGAFQCVGGPSVFYGGVSLRFRPADFEPDPEIAPDGIGGWPIRYADLQPFYAAAERILGVVGTTAEDPTRPPRQPGPALPEMELTPVSSRIAAAAERLGLAPFRLPLVLHTGDGGNGRAACTRCATCDGFACAIGAKNDLATAVLPPLLAQGLTLRTNTVARRVLDNAGRVRGVEALDTATGEVRVLRARRVLLAAGALFSPQLVLASGLEARNPGGHNVGRYLMRHCNGSVYGFFPRLPGADEFHKHVGVNDYYFGHPSVREPVGKLGNLQQVPTPAPAYALAHLPEPLGAWAGAVLQHLTGLLAIAEDQPRYRNRVDIDPLRREPTGLPGVIIHHRHTERDLAARAALMGKAREILREAGAWFCYSHRIDTFSHAVGTLRAGDDPDTSVIDRFCGFRGVEGLYVVDGSMMPTSSGINPSLTIAANALRVAAHIAEQNR